MLTPDDKAKIRKMFLLEVDSGLKRSRIMRVAAFLSEGESDEEVDDIYYSTMYHLSQPENEKELDEMYNMTAGWMPDVEEGRPAPAPKPKAPRGKKVRRVKP
jgi:hypothetical protein